MQSDAQLLAIYSGLNDINWTWKKYELDLEKAYFFRVHRVILV